MVVSTLWHACSGTATLSTASSRRPTWSLRAVGGTYAADEFGTLRCDAQVVVDVHDGRGRAPAGRFGAVVTGPPGWNDDEPLTRSLWFTGYAQTLGFHVGETVAAAAPESFALTMFVHGQELRTDFVVDPAHAVEPPVVTVVAATPALVEATWDPVVGAAAYHALLYTHVGQGGRELIARQWWLSETAVRFEDLALDADGRGELEISVGTSTEGLVGVRDSGSFDSAATRVLLAFTE